MINLALSRLSCGLIILALSACGSDQAQKGDATAFKAILETSVKGAGQNKSPQAAGIGLTRAALANIITPVDLVTVERKNAQAVIAKIATNQGVETWSSVDHKTLGLRNGVIVASRGLGDDLMSASVPGLGPLQIAGSTYQRLHVTLDGEDKPVKSVFDCRVTRNGAETITVVELAYATQHMTETCSGTSGQFSNEYWFQIGGKLRRSRQWISNSIGFVVIEHLQ